MLYSTECNDFWPRSENWTKQKTREFITPWERQNIETARRCAFFLAELESVGFAAPIAVKE